ncbi:hypothetical protein SLA2020_426980 [Shorea laevis]
MPPPATPSADEHAPARVTHAPASRSYSRARPPHAPMWGQSSAARAASPPPSLVHTWCSLVLRRPLPTRAHHAPARGLHAPVSNRVLRRCPVLRRCCSLTVFTAFLFSLVYLPVSCYFVAFNLIRSGWASDS